MSLFANSGIEKEDNNNKYNNANVDPGVGFRLFRAG
jgi:hypothetical protein